MLSKKFCVYNENRSSFVSAGITVVDAAFGPMSQLNGTFQLKLESGLWLPTSKVADAATVLSAFDLICLDEEDRVIQSTQLSSTRARAGLAPVDPRAASALIVPPNTIGLTRTANGDQLIICVADEMVRYLAYKSAAGGIVVAEQPVAAEIKAAGAISVQHTTGSQSQPAPPPAEQRPAFPQPPVREPVPVAAAAPIPAPPSMPSPAPSPVVIPQPSVSAPAASSPITPAHAEPAAIAPSGPVIHEPERRVEEEWGSVKTAEPAKHAAPGNGLAPATNGHKRIEPPVDEYDGGFDEEYDEEEEPAPAEATNKQPPAEMNSWKARLLRWLVDLPTPARRLPYPGLVAFYWTGGAPQSYIVGNISSTGIYLVTKERWTPGTVIMMTLQRTDLEDEEAEESITVMSQVVRWGPDGVGLHFVPPDLKGNSEVHSDFGADKKALDVFLRKVKPAKVQI
ncbi:MAG TPA: hypothetical protein VFI20_09385 [Terracidiphilus sp.]|nr:hypothetical protein [Terracidiphilus sp.]